MDEDKGLPAAASMNMWVHVLDCALGDPFEGDGHGKCVQMAPKNMRLGHVEYGWQHVRPALGDPLLVRASSLCTASYV